MRICEHCEGDIEIRNPMGYCDHLYYPDCCEICSASSKNMTADQKEIASLKSKLEKEHENFLAVHRHNMEIVGHNMELKSKLEAKDEVIRNCELVIKTLLEFYIDCSNGDAGFWDAEKSIEVVQARECLSRIDAQMKKGD